MELIESDMKKLLSSNPPVPLQEDHIVTIMYNSLCALNFMHSANIIHRDIKPGNFLINSNCSVKICDFGLSRSLPKKCEIEREFRDSRKKLYQKVKKSNYEDDKISYDEFKQKISVNVAQVSQKLKEKPRDLSNSVVSRWYRAPEIILTQKKYDQAIDIWSMGCILAELIYSS